QGRDHLPHLYFTRENGSLWNLAEPVVKFVDPHFNPSHDRLHSRIKAMQRFNGYGHHGYREMDKPDLYQGNDIHKESRLHWTSSKAALTELVYALHTSKALNHGKAEVKDIAEILQKVFDYDLGDFYKIFSEIKSRKKSR